MAKVPTWSMKGVMTGDCNCDWGCPCNFDAPPSRGYCDGIYTFNIAEGQFGEVDISGLTFAFGGHAPGAIHEGNMTQVVIIDDRATPEQWKAIDTLAHGDGTGMPFEGFAEFTTTWLDTITARIDFLTGGDLRSTTVKADGGEIYELVTSRVHNPVTGEEEELYLDKPSGFTSLRSELGTSKVARFNAGGLSFDHTGRYAEWAEFDYSGPD